MAPAPATDIAGDWTLIATREYGPDILDTTWKAKDTVRSKVTVKFSSDSVFSYNPNFIYAAQHYDRYDYMTMIYTPYPFFRVFATAPPGGNIPNFPVQARLQNPNAVVITYMGVDVSNQELYIRSGR